MRGSHTHGWGAKKKHRGGGSQAGKGGSNKFFARKASAIAAGEFGKKGFFPVTSKEVRAINIEQLDELARNNQLKEIDVSAFGHDKVLGSGKITLALTVKAPRFSAGAKRKIEASGGKVIVAQEE